MLGALAGYFRNSRLLKVIGMRVMALQPLPTYIVGLALVIFLGYLWPIFPISGGAQVNLPPALGWTYIRSVIVHGTLPALTLVLVGLGGWFISMRSLVSNIVTDDHVVYAELAGVRSRTIFSQYVARNAMLPQVTGLALNLGHVFSGAVIVEFIFGYPGMGQLLIAGHLCRRLQPGARRHHHRHHLGGDRDVPDRHPLSADRSPRETGIAAC